MIPTTVEQALLAATSASGREWLTRARADVTTCPTAVRTRFPAAGRCVGRTPLPTQGEVPGGPLFVWTTDDAARGVLLDAVGDAAASELEGLYRHGDTAERRAVLRWIGLLPEPTPLAAVAVEVVEDALRSNDPRLVAAALGPWAVRVLPVATLNQAVLKCVFLGVPLAGVRGLDERASPELARMLAGYVHERVAAGRDVAAEVWPLIDRHPPLAELSSIEAELDHELADRREAARAALAARRPGGPVRSQ